MKITGLDITAFRSRFPHGGERIGTLIEVRCETGIEGSGICWEDARAAVPQVAELLIGEDPRGVVALRQAMLDAATRLAHPARFSGAIAVLDLALWDLKAKLRCEPLWRTLGASRPRVNVHAAGFGLCETDDAIAARCANLVEQFGFRAAKLPVGADSDAGLRRLELLRQALRQRTRQPELMVDEGERGSPQEVIRAVKEMEQRFDITWVESPVAGDDFLGHKSISDSIKAAVCAGGDFSAPGDYLPHFQHRSLDIVEVSVATLGVGGALEVADCAFGYEIPVALADSPGNIHAHLAAAMPYCMSLEILDPQPSGLFTSDVRIVDGWAVAGDRAGHGLEIDRAALEKSAIGTAVVGESRGAA